jgi:hypothetical protein
MFVWPAPPASIGQARTFDVRIKRKPGQREGRWRRKHLSLNAITLEDADQEVDLSGASFGAQLSAQRQIGNLVIGIEADYSAAVMLEEQTFTTKDGFVDWTIEQQLDFFGTVRGRLGFTMDRLMVYGTRGLA